MFTGEYQVLSYNSNENRFENDTACVICRIEKEVFEIEMEDGVSLKVTADHPICVQDTEGNISYRTLNDGLDGYFIITKI